MGLILSIVLVIWIVCGTLAYGLDFAYWQRHFPKSAQRHYVKNRRKATFLGLLGPFGLMLCYLDHGCGDGFKWW